MGGGAPVDRVAQRLQQLAERRAARNLIHAATASMSVMIRAAIDDGLFDAAVRLGSEMLRAQARQARQECAAVDAVVSLVAGEPAGDPKPCPDCEGQAAMLEQQAEILDRPVQHVADLALILGGSDDSWTGDFLRLVAKSDPEHRAKLRAAFPLEVRLWERWMREENETPSYGQMWMQLAELRTAYAADGRRPPY